jgi:hypothetical protein
MVRKLIVLLFVSTVAVSINAGTIPTQKPKKIEVTFSSVMNALHKNAYLVSGIYNAILLGGVLSNDLYNYCQDYHLLTGGGPTDMYTPEIKFFIMLLKKNLRITCCVHLIYASFWTLIEGAFIKYITKECDVNQE